MRLPDFLLIGASKSGTSTLYRYLQRHPQLYLSEPKEPEYFASEGDANFARGLDWYAALFAGAQPGQVAGEASGRYTHWPHYPLAAPRIAQTLPNAKLIYIMRHPVERAYSHYTQTIKYAQLFTQQHKVRETFEASLERDNVYVDASHYMMQIEQYTPFFPKDALLFLLFDDLKRAAAATLAQICRFLGVADTLDLVQDQPIHANDYQHHKKWYLRARTTAPLRAIPGAARAARLLPKGARDWLYKAVLARTPIGKRAEDLYIPKPMLPETRARLLERFREPNARLAEYLGRDLAHWSR